MNKTLQLSASLVERLEAEAARRNVSVDEVIQLALVTMCAQPQPARIPSFSMGEPSVDIADCSALHEQMD